MIRQAQRSELPAILELWLESTTWGHPFIEESYWRDCIPLVRDAYLANAQNWVWEENGEFLGFASIMEGRFLAALWKGGFWQQCLSHRRLSDAVSVRL